MRASALAEPLSAERARPHLEGDKRGFGVRELGPKALDTPQFGRHLCELRTGIGGEGAEAGLARADGCIERSRQRLALLSQ